MGIHNLWGTFRQRAIHGEPIDACRLQGLTLAVDVSLWVSRAYQSREYTTHVPAPVVRVLPAVYVA